MKNLLFSLLLLLIGNQIALAQNKNLIVPELSSAGIYIDFGQLPAKAQNVSVERDKGQGFEQIAVLNLPLSKDMLSQRLQNYALILPNYYSVSTKLVTNIWDMLQTQKLTEIKNSNIPVVMLALGGAFLDTAKNIPANTKYKIQIGDIKLETAAVPSKAARPLTGQIIAFALKPAAQVIRAEWRLNVKQQPPMLEMFRKRVGIDSNFKKLNTSLGYEKTKLGDSLSIHLSDTTVLPGITYSYFLSGKNYLGNIISQSDTITNIAGNRTSVNAINSFSAKPAKDSSGIALSWNKQNVNLIRSIRVFRSAYYDTSYVQVAVLAPTDTVFVDRSAAIGANYYYQISAQGDQDFSYTSPRVFGMYINNKRLLAPTSLKASVNADDITFNWTYQTYFNLLGFRLYRAVGNSGKFEAISDVISAPRDSMSFVYSLKKSQALSNQFYTYAVAAISRSFKESPLSQFITLNNFKKQTLAAPTQLRSLELDDKRISITWQDMRKIDPNIGGYHVYRKIMNADSVNGYKLLTENVIIENNEFIDKPEIGIIYQYMVKSVNGTDSSVFSLPLSVIVQGSKPLPPGSVRLFAQKKIVNINWDGTLIPEVKDFNIYRATSKGEAVKIGRVPVTQTSFEDRNTTPGELYFYYITTETIYKVESNRSSEVSIRAIN